MSAGFNVPRLYRHILKAAKEFPSKKRAGIIEDIKIEFRDNKVNPSYDFCVKFNDQNRDDVVWRLTGE